MTMGLIINSIIFLMDKIGWKIQEVFALFSISNIFVFIIICGILGGFIGVISYFLFDDLIRRSDN